MKKRACTGKLGAQNSFLKRKNVFLFRKARRRREILWLFVRKMKDQQYPRMIKVLWRRSASSRVRRPQQVSVAQNAPPSDLKMMDFRMEIHILEHTSYLLGDGSPPSRGREFLMLRSLPRSSGGLGRWQIRWELRNSVTFSNSYFCL